LTDVERADGWRPSPELTDFDRGAGGSRCLGSRNFALSEIGDAWWLCSGDAENRSTLPFMDSSAGLVSPLPLIWRVRKASAATDVAVGGSSFSSGVPRACSMPMPVICAIGPFHFITRICR
jgi:hypothetical protein